MSTNCLIFSSYDVAVIDEIQMLSDIERGWAWTRAFLGLCAEEIHICGEARALAIISLLVDECEDELKIQEYKRLGLLRYVFLLVKGTFL